MKEISKMKLIILICALVIIVFQIIFVTNSKNYYDDTADSTPIELDQAFAQAEQIDISDWTLDTMIMEDGSTIQETLDYFDFLEKERSQTQ